MSAAEAMEVDDNETKDSPPLKRQRGPAENDGKGILDLPEEILFKIFRQLGITELHGNVALVCKKLLAVSRSPSVIKTAELEVTDSKDLQFAKGVLELHVNIVNLKIRLKMIGQKGHPLFENLRNLRCLKSFEVNTCNRPFGFPAPTLMGGLISLNSLQVIDLYDYMSHMPWTAGQLEPLFENNKQLKTIRLSKVTGDVITLILSAMASTLEDLAVLDYTKTPPDWSLLSQCSKLTSLNMSYSLDFWTAMSKMTTLKLLNVRFWCVMPNFLPAPKSDLLSLELSPVHVNADNTFFLNCWSLWPNVRTLAFFSLRFYALGLAQVPIDQLMAWTEAMFKTVKHLAELRIMCTIMDPVEDQWTLPESSLNPPATSVRELQLHIDSSNEQHVVTALKFLLGKCVNLEHLCLFVGHTSVMQFFKGQMKTGLKKLTSLEIKYNEDHGLDETERMSIKEFVTNTTFTPVKLPDPNAGNP